MRGRLQCLTIASKNWLRFRTRFATGKERLSLQGLQVNKHQKAIDSTPEQVLNHLAGNSVNFFNQAQGLVSALAVVGERAVVNFASIEVAPLLFGEFWPPNKNESLAISRSQLPCLRCFHVERIFSIPHDFIANR